MKQLFLKIKPCKVLLLLKDSQQQWYPSKLARDSSCSYVHVVNLLGALRKTGIVSLERKGRQNLYKLTEKGAYLALTLDDFSKKCETAEAEAHAKPEDKSPQGKEAKPPASSSSASAEPAQGAQAKQKQEKQEEKK